MTCFLPVDTIAYLPSCSWWAPFFCGHVSCHIYSSATQEPELGDACLCLPLFCQPPFKIHHFCPFLIPTPHLCHFFLQPPQSSCSGSHGEFLPPLEVGGAQGHSFLLFLGVVPRHVCRAPSPPYVPSRAQSHTTLHATLPFLGTCAFQDLYTSY